MVSLLGRRGKVLNLANINIPPIPPPLSGAKSATSQAEIEKHLELGRDYLVRGQLTDALTHYHAAVGEFQETEKGVNRI